MSRTRRGREQLTDRAEIPRKLARVLAARLNRQPEELTRRDVLRYQAEDLARESSMSDRGDPTRQAGGARRARSAAQAEGRRREGPG